MNIANNTNRFLSKANLYFGAALIVLVLTTVLLLVMLRGQSKINSIAQILIDKTATFNLEAKQLTANLQDYKTTSETTDISQVIPDHLNINDITREFDNYFTQVEGYAVNTSLNFTSSDTDEETGLDYVDASLSINSDEANFYNFLQYIETSGISSTSVRRLMEVRAIDINFSEQSKDDWSYKITVRIYYKELNNTKAEDEQS